jgi:hypothetical protein
MLRARMALASSRREGVTDSRPGPETTGVSVTGSTRERAASSLSEDINSTPTGLIKTGEDRDKPRGGLDLKAHRDPVARVALAGTFTGEAAKDVRSRHTPFGIGRKMAAIIGKFTINANFLCNAPRAIALSAIQSVDKK